MRSSSRAALAALLLGSSLTAQVPDGWYVFSAFGANRGPVGLFMAHPRSGAQPTPITGLTGDLATSGPSSCLYRESDGTLIVGERVAGGSGHSVDLHLITLEGAAVQRDILISVGVGGSCCGEIPQAASMSDGRIVVAATDLTAGSVLANLQTAQYGWEGVGIVDPESGLVTPVPIQSPPTEMVNGVFNGLALSPDEQTLYVSDYYSGTQGNIWAIPFPAGGTPVLAATIPSGASNLAFDAAGDLWVTGLGSSAGSLFRIDLASGTATSVGAWIGPMNAVAPEQVTGNVVVATANGGTPARSLFWVDSAGMPTLLVDPALATISGIGVRPNPGEIGAGTPGSSTYEWRVAPNPGGLPHAGNLGFSLTLEAGGGTLGNGAALICLNRLATPFDLLGLNILVDPGTAIATVPLAAQATSTLPLALPAGSAAVGLTLFVQSVHTEPAIGFAASNTIRLTVL